MVSNAGVELDHVATRAFSFVLQMRTLGLKLFEPRQHALRISAIFYQGEEVLYRAFDLAKAPGPAAISLNARGFQSLPLMRIFAHDFGDNAVVEQIALNCAECALLDDTGRTA